MPNKVTSEREGGESKWTNLYLMNVMVFSSDRVQTLKQISGELEPRGHRIFMLTLFILSLKRGQISPSSEVKKLYFGNWEG